MHSATLLILLGVFSINFMDRQILAILAEAIKQELSLSDTQIGLLYGFAFAALYATAGIPIARYADRANRASIINWSLVAFSVMSAACGLAVSYWELIGARIGVAVGESGTNPPSHSIIADLFPVNRRSTAMAVFSLGPHLGLLLGFVVGGWVGQFWGWRVAFLVAGLSGLVFVVPSVMFLRNPGGNRSTPRLPQFRAAVSALFVRRSARHLFAGATIFTAVAYSVVGWLPSMLMRSGFSIGVTGSILALLLGLAGAAGTLLGGMLADRLGRPDPAWRLRVVALVLLLMAPAWAAAFLVGGAIATLGLLVLPAGLLGFYLGPTFAMVQSLAPPETRATAAAALLFLGNTVGLGLGPVAIGALSDALLPIAGQDSLRLALLTIVPLCLWAAYHYNVAASCIGIDIGAVPGKPDVEGELLGALEANQERVRDIVEK
jgi:MFS family permease